MSASVLRQCTAALSPRALSRAAPCASTRHAFRAVGARRHYADDKAGSSSADAADAPAADTPASSPELAECQKKLAAKEAEAVDLTVCAC
jgi:hypothetical protein